MDITQYSYDKDEIKENITIEQMYELLAEMGAEPTVNGELITAKTICHGGDSHKLYYYDNTHLFHCYTGCATPTFDIFELVSRVKTRENGNEFSLPFAIDLIARRFGYAPQFDNTFADSATKKDLLYFSNYDRIQNIEPNSQTVELKTYDSSFLNNYPQPRLLNWEREGIANDTVNYYNIHYDPVNHGIIIPHYDYNNNLIGVRERILNQEVAETFGKYLPMKHNGVILSHPLSFSLYGLNKNKDIISATKKAIVLEGEKSVLQMESILGRENNISVACCGSSLIAYQVKLLVDLGVKDITVALDRQFKALGDNEHKKLVHNLEGIHKKYGKFVNINYIFDRNMITPYKASPTDCGKDVFLKLYRERVNLY